MHYVTEDVSVSYNVVDHTLAVVFKACRISISLHCMEISPSIQYQHIIVFRKCE